MIVIGKANYNNHHLVDLLWDDKAEGFQAIKARAFNEKGYSPVTTNLFATLHEAIKDIPGEFTDWYIFDEVKANILWSECIKEDFNK